MTCPELEVQSRGDDDEVVGLGTAIVQEEQTRLHLERLVFGAAAPDASVLSQRPVQLTVCELVDEGVL